MNHVLTLRVAGKTVFLESSVPEVIAWSECYFGPWWNATPTGQQASGPLVIAEKSRGDYEKLSDTVISGPHQQTAYARAATLVALGEDGVVSAVTPSEQLAYHYDPATRCLRISGTDTEKLAMASARLVREMMRGQLLRDGWTVLHASAVVRADGGAILAFGGKGSGKTTTALTLAATGKLGLLANDRVFVRPDQTGKIQVLPWPAAAAVGLGLLQALGWSDLVRARLKAGESLHPTGDQRVTDALLAGNYQPLWDGSRELKAQIWPAQFPQWFGIELATSAHADTLVFPQVSADYTPEMTATTRALTDADFMVGKTEDRYPDIFGLTAGIDSGRNCQVREVITDYFSRLPGYVMTLNHDNQAGAALVKTLLALRNH